MLKKEKSPQKQIDILSLFECNTPVTSYRVRRRQLFGGQLFASETFCALFEGLISQQEFDHVRSVFYHAQKIRAHYEVGLISKQEYYTHAVTLFSNILGVDECNDTNTHHLRQSSYDNNSRQHLQQHVVHDVTERENVQDGKAVVQLRRQSSRKDSEEQVKHNLVRHRSSETVVEKQDSDLLSSGE
eukprot:TRINITY_DN8731_c1_g1_i5.p1 TRINITY_DN8731_c1_g1~~TRINITY_DN8731_c1_g1_i5.p1  ORF type:complete len:186 (+),score=16.90 TRINITY_DN8731_c1_g1_i5:276-833(+)